MLWKVAKDALLTNEHRLRKGLAQSATCPRCNYHVKIGFMCSITAPLLLRYGHS